MRRTLELPHVRDLLVGVAVLAPLCLPAAAAPPTRGDPGWSPTGVVSVRGDTAETEVSLPVGVELPTGLGLAAVFDGTRLRLLGIDEVFAPGLLAVSAVSEEDREDLDGDAATDRLVRMAWLAPAGDWEGGTGGVRLARLRFRILDGNGWEARGASPVRLISLSPSRRFLLAPRPGDRAAWGDDGRQADLEAVSTVEVASCAAIAAGETGVATTCSLDVDGNGQFDALTDGILVMRHLFGFSGSSLVKDAVGGGATRSGAEAITSFLGSGGCTDMLDADGNGAKDALTDGVLAARYLFGFTGASLVNGAVAANAARKDGAAVGSWLAIYKVTGPALELMAPSLAAPLVSQLPATLPLQARYTGTGALRYSLAQGPSGMTIDARYGTLAWTPPASMEGQQATVRAGVTDGQLASEVTFTVRVAAATQIATSVNGSTVTVTQTGNLQGVALTIPSQSSATASQVKVSTVAAAQAPPVPSGVTRVSDFFRASPVTAPEAEDIAIALPSGGLPSGRRREELRLYVYVDKALGVPAPFWMPVRRGLDLLTGGKVKVTRPTLGQLSFIGLPATAGGQGARPASALAVRTGSTAATTCEKEHFSDGSVAYDQHVCTVSGNEGFTVTIRDLASASWSPMPSPEVITSWLVQAKQTFRPWGMLAAPAFEVVVETFSADDARLSIAAGYCDDSGDLHMSRTIDTQDKAKTATVHEFFHHAQRKTKSTAYGFWPLFNTYPTSSWFLEGTALWFEDEVYDGMNSYMDLVGQPFPHILEVGLASPEPASLTAYDSPQFPYSRFAFFKWVHSKCGVLNFMYLLNPKMAYEESGLENLAAWIHDRGCSFGDGFGSSNAGSFATALLGYASATTWVRDLSLLESDEEPQGFNFAGIWQITPDAGCTPEGDCPAHARAAFSLPPGGARSLVVQGIQMDVSNGAFMKVWADEPVWVSVWSAEEIPVVNDAELDLGELGTNMHATWFRSDEDDLYEYSDGQAVTAGLFVTVVNPSPTATATVQLRAGATEAAQGKPFDESMTNNANAITTQTFSIRAVGTMSGPQTLGFSVQKDYGSINLHVSAPANQEGVLIEGRVEGGVSPLTARKTYSDGSYTEYTYSNKRYVIDLDESPTANTYRFEFPSFITQGSGKACIYYDLRNTDCDKDNNCQNYDRTANRCVYFWVTLQ